MLLIDDSFEAAAALGKHSPMTLLILVAVAQAESSKKFLVTNDDAKILRKNPLEQQQKCRLRGTSFRASI